MYDELKDRGFVILSVALDTGGARAVRKWIRPPEPIDVPPLFQDIMAWSAQDYARAAVPTYPCLIDEKHVVAELYSISNVPMAVWIDEDGRIVRPAEPTGATDGFRSIDRTTFTMPADVAAAGRVERKRYVDAVRDWVTNGEASRYALPADVARERVRGPSHVEALGAANFALGQYLFARGDLAQAKRYFGEATRLCPEHWHYFRQALELEETGKASGPEFAAAVAALGERSYYPAVDLDERS